MASEEKITSDLRDLFTRIKQDRKEFYWVKISDRYSSGIPDFYIAFETRSAWIEVKKEGEKPSKIQYYTLSDIQRAGIPTFWGDNYREIEDFVLQEIVY